MIGPSEMHNSEQEVPENGVKKIQPVVCELAQGNLL